MTNTARSEARPNKRCLLTANGSILVLFASPAYAQDPLPFVPVEDRARPDYQTRPLNVGALDIIPVIRADIEHVDNLFATEQNQLSDTLVTVTPGVTIRDRRQDRVLQIRLEAGYESYLENSFDDRLLVNARANARFGLGTTTRPFGGANFSRNDTRGQDFSRFSEAVQPLKLTTFGGNAGVEQDIGDFTHTLEGRYRNTEYDGDIVVNGVPFDSGLRDFETYAGRARVAYTRDPSQSFYIEGYLERYDYSAIDNDIGLPQNLTLDRSSEGASLSLGFARRLTEILQLDVNVGYLNLEYDDPAFDTINTVSFDGSIFWNPTRLTTIQARASRIVEQTNNPFSSGLLRTGFSLAAQHELRRNVVIGAEGQFASIDLGEQVRSGRETSFSGFVRYFANERLSFRLQAEHFDRNVIFPGTQNRIMLGAQINF